MPKVHVCLVSDQPMPNVTSCLQLEPEQVELLFTRDKLQEAMRLEEFLKARGMIVKGVEIDPFDIKNVTDNCTRLIAEHGAENISLNVTGGTKVAALGAYQAFHNQGCKIFYVNTSENEIIQLAPSSASIPIKIKISIPDYLDVHGFRPESWTKDDSRIKARAEVSSFLAELAIARPKLIGALNYSFRDDVKSLTYPFRLKLPSEVEFSNLTQLMEKSGLATQASGSSVTLPDVDIAQFLRGFWFEEHVYLSAKKVPGVEVVLNMIGRWETNRKIEPKNEFDVMVASGNRLLYLSCKTSNADRDGAGREYLYELDSLGDRALGLFGKKVLASARSITDKYIQQRAINMGIEILDGEDIRDLPKRIKQWLKL